MTNENKIIDGKSLAAEIRADLAKRIAAAKATPVLAVVLAGENEASRIYVRNKEKACQEIGIDCRIFCLETGVTQEKIETLVKSLSHSQEINGIIIQQPLPQHLDGFKLLKLINREKDVDGFGPENLGLLLANSKEAVISATPKGILKMLKSVIDDLSGKNVVIIGRSNIVGKPLAALLLNQDCTVTVTHSKTVGLPRLAAQADILIAACGCAKLVQPDWIKPGAVVIDVGMNRNDGKLCGDVDFEKVSSKAAFISPVPGGVGPMTIAMLLENTFEAFCKQTLPDRS